MSSSKHSELYVVKEDDHESSSSLGELLPPVKVKKTGIPVVEDDKQSESSKRYFLKHHINELFESLMNGLAVEKPVDPLLFLEESVEVLRREKHRLQGDKCSVINDGDVYLQNEAIPSSFDKNELHNINQRQAFVIANMEKQAMLSKPLGRRKSSKYLVDSIHLMRNELSKPLAPLNVYCKPPVRVFDTKNSLKTKKLSCEDKSVEEDEDFEDELENEISDGDLKRMNKSSIIDLATYDKMAHKGLVSIKNMGKMGLYDTAKKEKDSLSESSKLLDECITVICHSSDFSSLHKAVTECIQKLTACDRVEVFRLYPNKWTKITQELKLSEVYDYEKLSHIMAKVKMESKPRLLRITGKDEIPYPRGGIVGHSLKTKNIIVMNSAPSKHPKFIQSIDDIGENEMSCVVYIPIIGVTHAPNDTDEDEAISLGVLQVARERPHQSPFLEQTISDLCNIAKGVATAYHKVYTLELEKLKQSIMIERILRREKLILFLQSLNNYKTCESVCNAMVEYITKNAKISQECFIYCRDFEQPELFQYVVSTNNACESLSTSSYTKVKAIPFAQHVIETGDIVNISDAENHCFHGNLLNKSSFTLNQSHRPSLFPKTTRIRLVTKIIYPWLVCLRQWKRRLCCCREVLCIVEEVASECLLLDELVLKIKFMPFSLPLCVIWMETWLVYFKLVSMEGEKKLIPTTLEQDTLGF